MNTPNKPPSVVRVTDHSSDCRNAFRIFTHSKKLLVIAQHKCNACKSRPPKVKK